MRLLALLPVVLATLAIAAPAPETDSPELVKRYCGPKAPKHPACPKGLYQCFGQCLKCGSKCNTKAPSAAPIPAAAEAE